MTTGDLCVVERRPRSGRARRRTLPGVKRPIDLLIASIGLVCATPVLAIAAAGIRWSSPGPILYKAQRLGLYGRPFTILKLRTMHVAQGAAPSAITAHEDPRVFAFGAWLRRMRIDELPQLLNVLRGDMSVVGPRPEDPRIVASHYDATGIETLSVRPGLTSPGTLFACLDGEQRIAAADPEGTYVREVLPRKLALDAEYVRSATLGGDLVVVARTVAMLTAKLFGSGTAAGSRGPRHLRLT